MIAGWTGLTIGELINNTLFIGITTKFWYWFVNVLVMLIIIIVACCNTNKHIIWLSALFGGFMIIKSLSIKFGHYPDSWNIYALIQDNAITRQEFNYYFIYVGVWMLCTILGIVFQCITMKYLRANPDKFKRIQASIKDFEDGTMRGEPKVTHPYSADLNEINDELVSEAGNILDTDSRTGSMISSR